jgi:hypothetical protein
MAEREELGVVEREAGTGGEGGIRTLETLLGLTGFRDRPDQPLQHLSGLSRAAILADLKTLLKAAHEGSCRPPAADPRQ